MGVYLSERGSRTLYLPSVIRGRAIHSFFSDPLIFLRIDHPRVSHRAGGKLSLCTVG